MNIQDRKKSFTAEELRQRYDLDRLTKDRKAIELSQEEIKNTGAYLQQFVEATTENLQELQDQVDGNITTWFFSGVPTLSNDPAVDWTTTTEKDRHLGDLYYDQNTGYAYRFLKSGTTYSWSKLTDSDVTEALAIANAAQDTADSKRRVFVAQPTVPYDIGDIWLKDGDLYRCQTATTREGSYNPSHWIKGVDYTDDTVANQALQELNQFKTDVEETYATNVTLETTTNSINARVDGNYTYITQVEAQAENNRTATDQQIQEIRNTVEANQTTTAYEIQVINQQLVNGVVKFDTGTGYTFDIEGLKINKTDSIIRLILDNNGLVVYRNNDEVFRADSDGVNAENITVRKFYVQKPIRVEKTKAISDSTKSGWGLFWVGE